MDPVEITIRAPREAEEALLAYAVTLNPALTAVKDIHLKNTSVEAEVKTPIGKVDVVAKIEVTENG